MASLTEQLLKGQQIQTNQSGNSGSLTEKLMQQQMPQKLQPSETSLPKSSNGIIERLKGALSNNPFNIPQIAHAEVTQQPNAPIIQDRISQGSPIQLSNAPQLARAHTNEIPKQSEIAQGLKSGAWNSTIGIITQSKYNPTSPQNMVKLGEFVSGKLPDGKVKDYVDSRTDAYVEQGQRVADLQNFNPTTIAGKAAQVAGTIGGDLPLWATGYGTVGQAVTKAPQVARLGKLSQEAVRGASVGAAVSPIESLVHGDDVKQSLQRAALNIGAGAVLDPAMMKLGSIISNAFKAKPTATIDDIVEVVAKEMNVPPTPELVKQVEDTIKLLPAPQNFTIQGLPNPYARPYTYADMPSQVKRTPFEKPKIELPKLNKDLFRPVDNVYQNQYNTRKEIESQLGKYYSSFDEGVGKIATEAIEDLKRVEGTIENSALRSNGFRPEGRLDVKARPSGIQDKPYKTVGLSFSKELIDTGKVNLTDIVYKDTKDLAVISQVYRDPRFETFRIVYVKGNENKIVGVDGVSSRIPGSSKVFIDTNANKSISKIQSRMNRLGADGYYLVHNHPSGDPTPSQSDVNVTAHLANKVKGFKEHIVINSSKFSRVYKDNARGWSGENDIPLSLGNDKLLSPSIEHDLLGKNIGGSDKLAAALKSFSQKDDVVTVFFSTPKFDIKGVLEVNADMFNNNKEIANFLRNQARENGGQNISIVGKSNVKDAAERLFKEGIIIDGQIGSSQGARHILSDVHGYPPAIQYNWIGSNKSPAYAAKTPRPNPMPTPKAYKPLEPALNVKPKIKELVPFAQPAKLGKQKVDLPLQFKKQIQKTDFELIKRLEINSAVQNKPIEPLLKQKDSTLVSKGAAAASEIRASSLLDEFRLKVNRDTKPNKKTFRQKFNELRTQLIDDLAPLEELERLVKGSVDEADKSLYKMGRLFRGSPTKAAQLVNDRIAPIIRSIEKEGFTYKDLGDYALAIHAKDVNAQGINSGFTDAQIEAVISKFGNSKLEQARKDLIKVSSDLLNELVDAQVLTREAVDGMQTKWKNYMPLFRSFDDDKIAFNAGLSKAMANVTNPIKKLEGSSRDIIDPIESMIKNVFKINNVADRNRVALQLSKLSKLDIDGKFIRRLDAVEEVGRKNVVSALENSEKVKYEVQPEVYKAILNLDKEGSNLLVRLLQQPTGVLRAGATLTPEFSLRNPMRDIAQAYMVSNSGFNPIIDFPVALSQVIKKGDLYKQWLKDNGGYGNLMSMDRKVHRESLEKIIKQPSSKRFVNILNGKSLINLLRNIADASESATKLGEYRAALRKGASRPEAAYRSRDIMDFARAGYSTREANKIVAFLNANIQGKSKLIRAIENDPVGVTVRGIKAVTLPSIAIFAIQKQLANEEQKRLIDDAPEWLQNTFWLVPIPNTNQVARIPKPFDVAPIFANLPESFMRYAFDKDPSAFDGMFKEMMSEAALPIMVTGVAPIIEGMANYSFFRQAPIIPRREQGLEYSDQKDVNTTEAAKFIAKGVERVTGGEGLFKNFASPRIVDNTIRGFTAGLGDYATSAIDYLVRKIAGTETERPSKNVSQQPLLKAFMINTAGTGKSVEYVYSERDKLQRKINSAKKAREVISTDDRVKLSILNNATDRIGDISTRMRNIQNSDRYTADEKRLELDKLNKLRNNIAIDASNRVKE